MHHSTVTKAKLKTAMTNRVAKTTLKNVIPLVPFLVLLCQTLKHYFRWHIEFQYILHITPLFPHLLVSLLDGCKVECCIPMIDALILRNQDFGASTLLVHLRSYFLQSHDIIRVQCHDSQVKIALMITTICNYYMYPL